MAHSIFLTTLDGLLHFFLVRNEEKSFPNRNRENFSYKITTCRTHKTYYWGCIWDINKTSRGKKLGKLILCRVNIFHFGISCNMNKISHSLKTMDVWLINLYIPSLSTSKALLKFPIPYSYCQKLHMGMTLMGWADGPTVEVCHWWEKKKKAGREMKLEIVVESVMQVSTEWTYGRKRLEK